MKTVILYLFLMFGVFCLAQDTISTSQAKDFIGKEIILKGTVASFKMAGEGKSTNYINVDKAFPDNVFTIVIPNYALDKLGFKIEDSKGKQIIVKGKVEIYEKDPNKIPQIFNPKEIYVR